MIGIPEVQLTEDSGVLLQFKGGRNEGERIPILDCDLVQALRVKTGSQSAILLPHKEKPSPSWGRGWMYETCSQSGVQEFLHYIMFWNREKIEPTMRGSSSGKKVNCGVIRTMRRKRCGLGLVEYLLQVLTDFWDF